MPKAFVELAGKTILQRALQPFVAAACFERIIIAVPADYQEQCKSAAGDWGSPCCALDFICGGSTRQQSVRAALKHVLSSEGFKQTETQSNSIVLVHDAARCLLPLPDLQKVIKGVVEFGAVSLGHPVTDSIKRVDSTGRVLESLKREELWVVQTPQAFRLDLLVKAHEVYADQEFSDDASMVEKLQPVQMINGSHQNFKITTSADLVRAEIMLKGLNRG